MAKVQSSFEMHKQIYTTVNLSKTLEILPAYRVSRGLPELIYFFLLLHNGQLSIIPTSIWYSNGSHTPVSAFCPSYFFQLLQQLQTHVVFFRVTLKCNMNVKMLMLVLHLCVLESCQKTSKRQITFAVFFLNKPSELSNADGYHIKLVNKNKLLIIFCNLWLH